MRDYLWVFVLSGIALVSAVFFLGTISKSSILVRKLKLPKKKLSLNFLLLIISLVDISLIIYVFLLIRDQISSLT